MFVSVELFLVRFCFNLFKPPRMLSQIFHLTDEFNPTVSSSTTFMAFSFASLSVLFKDDVIKTVQRRWQMTMRVEPWRIDTEREEPKYRKRTCPIATLSTINATWIGLRGEGPTTLRLWTCSVFQYVTLTLKACASYTDLLCKHTSWKNAYDHFQMTCVCTSCSTFKCTMLE